MLDSTVLVVWTWQLRQLSSAPPVSHRPGMFHHRDTGTKRSQGNYTSTFQECSFKVEEWRRWSWASRETTVARGHRAGFQRATAQGVPRISWEFHPGPDKVMLRACTGGKAWGWRKNQMSISGVQGLVLPRITGTTLAPADLAENREDTGHWVQYEDKFCFKTGE